MNNLILTFLLLSLSAISIAQDCPSGQNFDSSLNRCVLTTSTVDTKTEANNCGGLTGEAQQNCYKQVVDTEVRDLENAGKVEEQTNSKGKYLIPTIMTIGSSYFLFKNKKSIAKCTSISLALMAGAGLTTLLGEVITQKSYKSKLRKIEENYQESIADKSTDTNDDLARINESQTNAFNFQIQQEEARESAHKSRRNIYNISAALYAGSAIAAVVEILWGSSPCATAPGDGVDTKKALDKATESIPKGETSYNFSNDISIDESLVASNQKLTNQDQIDYLNASGITFFKDFSFINNFTPAELVEIVTRNIFNKILPSAQATPPPPGSTHHLLFQIEGIADSVTSKVSNVLKSPTFRAAFSTVLAGYSKIVANKASKHAKEAKERVKAIEEIRDAFLANGGAGLTNCTSADRNLPSKPTCYCYESDGSRRSDRSSSPTCQAVFGAAASDLPGATDFNSTAANAGSFPAQGCLTNTGGLDEQCQCQRTNTCSSFSGSLNLGNLGQISGLTQAVSDASNFTNGTIGAGDINAARLEQGIANISAQQDKLANNPKTAAAVKKADEIAAKLERSFGNSVRDAFNNPKTAGDLASLLSGSIGGEDSTKDLVAKKKPTKFKAGQKVEAKASAPALRNGSKAGVSLDDFDFSTKNKGGIKVEDGAKDLAEGKFKIDDINDKTEANIFSIISNRYQTTGLKTLFGDDKKQ